MEINSLETSAETEHKNAILKRLFYNISQAGLHIPVQVIYDLPENQQRSNIGNENAGATNISRSDRNSRRRNLTDVERIKESIKQQYLGNNNDLDIAEELVSNESNRSKSALALIINRPEFFQRINNTRKKVPIIFHLFSQPSATAPPVKNTTQNDSNAGQKFIIPILDKLKEINARPQVAQLPQYQEPQIAQTAPVPQIVLPAPQMPFRKIPSAPTPFYYPNTPISYYGQPSAPPPYIPYPTPPQYYQPYDMYRQWSYPFPSYPMLLPDPYSMPMNVAPESAHYMRNGEICHTKFPFYSNYQRTRRNIDETAELTEDVANNETAQPLNEDEFEFGKRRYDDDPQLIEYVDNVRQKRNARRKDRRPVNLEAIQSREGELELKRHEEKPAPAHGMRQGTDVGPQISKLIVRRGGVAIAGAGGIATAGSGGTAIVGPGGTAFTTPASSGGVAMVGPGGKVVKVPDLTNVLYGRTANVAATGAGHATFTNKEGEVFTTSDNTGGVALVNPSGGLFGVSDGENIEYGEKTSKTKEVQLPAGARLLTTGPIIYYNPVYPTNQL